MIGGGNSALGFKLFRRAETAVGFALGKQALSVLGIDRQPLRLTIGSVGAFFRRAEVARAFVPVQAEPAKVFDELLFKAGLRAFQVGVFNAQDEVAAGAAGEEPVVERSARISDVEQAGRGRGKSDTNFRGSHGSNDDSPSSRLLGKIRN